MRDEGWKERVERWGKRDQWWGSWWVNIEWWEMRGEWWETWEEGEMLMIEGKGEKGGMVSGWGLSGIERKGVGSNVTRGLCLNGECYKIFNPGVIKNLYLGSSWDITVSNYFLDFTRYSPKTESCIVVYHVDKRNLNLTIIYVLYNFARTKKSQNLLTLCPFNSLSINLSVLKFYFCTFFRSLKLKI